MQWRRQDFRWRERRSQVPGCQDNEMRIQTTRETIEIVHDKLIYRSSYWSYGTWYTKYWQDPHGVTVYSFRTSALAICYSVAEYCGPVWPRSSRTNPTLIHSWMRLYIYAGHNRNSTTDFASMAVVLSTLRILISVIKKQRPGCWHKLNWMTTYRAVVYHPASRLPSRRPIFIIIILL